jgi:hypothetical protein
MRKKRTIAKSRAASLKGWRTKQRMQKARSMPTADDVKLWSEQFIDWLDPTEVHGRVGGREFVIKRMPNYMRRALPNPWLKQ